MTTQVFSTPLASLSHGEVMNDYVINDCCPNFIRASYVNATQGPLYFYRINTLAHTGGRGRTFTAEQILPFYCKLKPVILTSCSIYMECGKMTVINIFVSESLPFCTQ